MGLQLQPLTRPMHMVLGVIVHRALELYYQRGTSVKDALDQAIEEDKQQYASRMLESEMLEYQEMTSTAWRVLRGYVEWVADTGADDHLTVLEVESTFELPMANFTLAGRWDGIVRDRTNGMIYILEHKTTSRMEITEAGVLWDIQPYVYAYAAEQVLGERVGGIIYNMLSTNDPYDIPILSNGMPSRAVRSKIRTTEQAYRDAILKCARDVGIDPKRALESYQKELEYVREHTSQYYQRLVIPRHDTLIHNTVSQVLRAAQQMRDTMLQAQGGIIPDPYRDRFKCVYCLVREACLAADMGEDPMEVLKSITYGGDLLDE